ncbi:MAG: ATP-dependent DNA ligase, partial [Myxococcales bacterium]
VTSAQCTPVINEFRTDAPGNANDEFVELYNPCTSARVLDGRLVYRSAAGTSDVSLVNFTTAQVTMPAGGYLLYGQTAYTPPTGVTKDGSWGGSIALGGGGLALRAAPGDATAQILDSVGYGTATNAFIEGAVCAAPASGRQAIRSPNGRDTNNNSADFVESTVTTPRAPNPNPVQ